MYMYLLKHLFQLDGLKHKFDNLVGASTNGFLAKWSGNAR